MARNQLKRILGICLTDKNLNQPSFFQIDFISPQLGTAQTYKSNQTATGVITKFYGGTNADVKYFGKASSTKTF